MLLFPLIHLAKFSLLMAIEENCDQISKQNMYRGGGYTFFFFLPSSTKTNKGRETTQNMSKYNSTTVAVNKKYT